MPKLKGLVGRGVVGACVEAGGMLLTGGTDSGMMAMVRESEAGARGCERGGADTWAAASGVVFGRSGHPCNTLRPIDYGSLAAVLVVSIVVTTQWVNSIA